MDKIINFLLVLLLGFTIGMACSQHCVETPTIVTKEKYDTLYIRDTIRQIEPIFVERRIVDTLTVRITDTTVVYLPKEQVTWKDSLCTVYASGYQPQVDSVVHYQVTPVITQIITTTNSPRWSLGISAGYAATPAQLSPYIGIGITYNLLSW